MSNPTLASTIPVNPNHAPSAYFIEGQKASVKQTLPDVVRFWYTTMGLEAAHAVVIDPATCMKGPNSNPLAEGMDTLAKAQVGGLHFTKRSGQAYRVNNAMWKTLTSSGEITPFTREGVRPAMVDKFYVSAGNHMFRGRFLKYYKETMRRKPREVVTPAEALRAKLVSGHFIRPNSPPVKKFVLFPEDATSDDDQMVYVNPHGDVGFPVQGRWEEPGVEETVLSLTRGILEVMQEEVVEGRPLETARNAERKVYSMQTSSPDLVLVKAKCKQDFNSRKKIEDQMMRFYNALPKQFMLIIQTATQAYEHQCVGLFEDETLHSAQKVHLVRGGADRLITIMQKQLENEGVGYVHVGDDSFLALRLSNGELLLTDLDCSSFDLTQNAAVTLAVHEAFRDDLAQIDPIAAGCWMAFMRRRLIAIEQTLVTFLDHAGPSGAALQSKVNDVLMEVLIHRCVQRLGQQTTEEEVGAFMKDVGEKMGFVLKVGQFHKYPAGTTIRQALAIRPFQFIGFYFHTRNGYVYPFMDLPRGMAQLAYPSGKWQCERRVFARNEAIRLVSIAMGAGIAPVALTATQSALNQEAGILLLEVLNDTEHADREDPRLKWATQVAPHVMEGGEMDDYAASITGLYRAFDSGDGALRIWAHPDDTSLFPLAAPAKIVHSKEFLLSMRPNRGNSAGLGPVFAGEDELPSHSEFLSKRFVALRPVAINWDLADNARDTVQRPRVPHPKTYGRPPRTKAQDEATAYAAKGRRHKLDAQERRAAEAYEGDSGDDLGPQQTGASRRQRAKQNSMKGSSAAARSVMDADGDVKDLRGGRGSRNALKQKKKGGPRGRR